MKFCSKCGNEILKGDKFCTKCGEEQCKDENVIWEIKRILITALVQPATTAKEVVERVSKNTAKYLTVVMVIVQGILGIWSTNMIFNNFKNITEGFMKEIPEFKHFSEFGIEQYITNPEEIIEMRSLLNISYGKIFINNSILLLITILITFSVVYVGTNMLLKTKVDFWNIYKISLIIILPIMYFQIFAILASYISLNLGVMLFVIGAVISSSTLVIVLKDEIGINDNKCVFIVAICTVIAFGIISFYVKRFVVLDYINLVNSFKDVHFNL